MNIRKEMDGLVVDYDGTLYQCPEYIEDGTRGEMEFLANRFGCSVEAATIMVQERKTQIKIQKGATSISFSVFSLGITWEEWNEVREKCYHPEIFLSHDPLLVALMERLNTTFKGKMCIVSNSPKGLVERGLRKLGLSHIFPSEKVLGPENGYAKPDSEIYFRACQFLGLKPEQCWSLGDSYKKDCKPALDVGYLGATEVKDRDGLLGFIHQLLGGEHDEQLFQTGELISSHFVPGQVKIVGITGPAGAGKTTMAKSIVNYAKERGIPCALLGLDSFFKLSSRERKLWIEEGKRFDSQEGAKRRDQINWWDFNQLQEAIISLRQTGKLELHGVYDRSNGGELTGAVSINSNGEGLLVILEGVAIAHLAHLLDHLYFIYSPAHIRIPRLKERDKHRQGPEVLERFIVTESFERPYFSEFGLLAKTFIDNSNGRPIILDRYPEFCGEAVGV